MGRAHLMRRDIKCLNIAQMGAPTANWRHLGDYGVRLRLQLQTIAWDQDAPGDPPDHPRLYFTCSLQAASVSPWTASVA